MKRRYTLLYIVLAAVTAIGHSACSDTDCTTSNTAYVNYGFYDSNNKHIQLVGPVSVTTAGNDSVLINRESNVDMLRLPLGYTHEVDTFVIHYTSETNGMFDTLFVKHQNLPQFLSMDCGMGMYHHIDEIGSTNNAIETIEIVNPEITYNATEHIKIYYRSNE